MSYSVKKLSGVLAFAFFCLIAAAQPTISNVSPKVVYKGGSVTISGNNFSATPEANIVYFGGGRATVTAATATSLTVTAPSSMTYGAVTVTVNNLTAEWLNPLLLTFNSPGPAIDDFPVDGVLDDWSGAETNASAVADFNNDGKPDIAMLSRGNAVLSVYRNTSDTIKISFASRVDFATGDNPSDVVAADINGDGKKDLVVSNRNSNTIFIYLNTSVGGNLSFAAPQSYDVVIQPSDIIVTDLDNDGKLDIAIAGSGLSGDITILRNTGSGGALAFASSTLSLVTGVSSKIESRDFDGDEKKDLALTNFATNRLQLLRNTSTPGNISFVNATSVETLVNPDEISVDDIDGDGKPDVIVTYLLQPYMSVFRNTSTMGTINFAAKVDQATFFPVGNITVGDLDGNQKPDLAMAAAFERIMIRRNNSTPGTIDVSTTLKQITFGGSAFKVELADFNGDGRIDLGVVWQGAYRATFFRNRSGLPHMDSFTPATATAGQTVRISGYHFENVSQVTFGGVPAASFTRVGSSYIDAVVGPGASGNVVVTTPNGKDSLDGFIYVGPPAISSISPAAAGPGETVTITGEYFLGTTTVKFGGKNAASFVIESETRIKAVVAGGSTSGNVEVTTPRGTAVKSGFTYNGPVFTSFAPLSAKAGETVTISGYYLSLVNQVKFGAIPAVSFNIVSDNTITAVVAGGVSGEIALMTASDTVKLPGFIYIPTPSPSILSFVPELAPVGATVTISGERFNSVAANNAVYFGQVRANLVSGGSGQLIVTVPAGASYDAIRVLDMETSLSAVSSRMFTPVFTGGRQLTANSFQNNATALLPPYHYPTNVTSGDLDGDGKVDMVATALNAGEPRLHIFRNTSAGRQVAFEPYAMPGRYEELELADLDGDGRLDIIAVLSMPPPMPRRIVILYNNSSPGATSFSKFSEFQVEGVIGKITTADLDGDGRPELIIGKNDYLHAFGVFRNTSIKGHISFDIEMHIAMVDRANVHHLAATDIDGDGKTDIVASLKGRPALAIFRNTSTAGTVSFATPLEIANTFGQTAGLAVGDLDKDGKNDMVVTTQSPSKIFIYKNNSTPGNPQLILHAEKPGNGLGYNVTIGDIDGDGLADVCLPNYYTGSSGNIGLLINSTTGSDISFKPEFGLPGGSPWSVSLLDADNDGKVDIVGANSNHSMLRIFRNTVDTPHIITFNPEAARAGEQVTITGYNLDGANSVKFGGREAASFNIQSSTTIVATIADGATGAVEVMTPRGLAKTNEFYFIEPLKITQFSPQAAAKGATVHISGHDFVGTTAVKFGGVSATSFNVISPFLIAAVVAEGASGEVQVVTPRGTATRAGFTFYDPPVLTSFAPSVVTENTQLTLNGINLSTMVGAKIGDKNVLYYTALSATSVVVTVPANVVGDQVIIFTRGGSDTLYGIKYVVKPEITQFSPQFGVPGTQVTITGRNLQEISSVKIGDVPAASFTINSATSISAVVGTGASGSVEVANVAGAASLPGFDFITPPVLTAFTPGTGAQGSTISLAGSNFRHITGVSFGGIPAASYVVNSIGSITAVIAQGTSGAVKVDNIAGTASLPGFVFIPAPVITQFTPATASEGTSVVIVGRHFTGASEVSFAAIPAASYVVDNDERITAVVGRGSSGYLRVTTAGGTSELSGFTFEIIRPVDPSGNSPELTVSPNPAGSVLNVNHPVYSQPAVLKITDLTGRVVLEYPATMNNNRTTIQIGGLNPGMYILNWSDGQRLYYRTFLKQ